LSNCYDKLRYLYTYYVLFHYYICNYITVLKYSQYYDKKLSYVHSFVVHSKESDRLLGAALNFDALDEPEVEFNGCLTMIFEFLEFLEGPIR